MRFFTKIGIMPEAMEYIKHFLTPSDFYFSDFMTNCGVKLAI